MLEKFEFLIALARERRFRRAAEQCGVTQPTRPEPGSGDPDARVSGLIRAHVSDGGKGAGGRADDPPLTKAAALFH